MESEQRIVITGIGAVSPLGLNCQETFEGMTAGKSGTAKISSFDASDITCQVAGEVKGFEPADYMDRKMARRIGRYAQFSIAATRAGKLLDSTRCSHVKHIDVYIYIYIHIYIYKYILYIYIYTYKHVCVCVYIYIYV